MLLSFTLHFTQFGIITPSVSLVHPVFWNPGVILPPMADTHVKLAFTILFCYLINKAACLKTSFELKHTDSNTSSFNGISICNLVFGKPNSKISRILYNIVLWVSFLNFILIALVNPSILNPGPSGLSIYFQNAQGLVPFSNLHDDHPNLNHTKVMELNTYIGQNKPDVVLLNETWLKKSIKDHEVIHSSNYNIFRCDRSAATHPPDPSDPSRYRRNGGGVMIAVRSDINGSSKKIKLNDGAEMAAVELTLDDKSKLIFCTCYRVGTLGLANHNIIEENLRSLFLNYKKKSPKIFVVGDFNLRSVHWPLDDNVLITNPTEKCHVDTFSELGLVQCINETTHIKGRTLDLLLTSHVNVQCLQNIDVLEHDVVCKSDHFPIKFEININIRRKRATKRKCYNFKRANWDALNADLCHINWNAILNCTEPEFAWVKFKTRLFELVNKHIPIINCKSEFNPPWFDSDLYDFCRKKERLRSKFKRSKRDIDGLKFSEARREFKKLVRQKMRDNMSNEDDPGLIKKKFWSHVKATSNSHRIPESVYFKNQIRSESSHKANLFNNFFFEQFSDASHYDIPINFHSDCSFDIPFCHRKIRKLLQKINSNKAQGPDGIHGKILKNCAVGLAYPLSLIFTLSYNTGYIPQEWKMANIVPVFKKGCKKNVENYRPISLTSLVMKTFERIMKDEILKRTSHFLDTRQHGFLNSKSCTTNLLGYCDSLALSLNNCQLTDVIYFDFAKAFDSVNHDILLHKLKYMYEIDGRLLKFLKNYLAGREQGVVIGNTCSIRKPVLSGVPQGSILGPLLFVLFINDISEGLTPGTDLALYADDTKIWRTIHSELDHSLLQNDVTYLNNWAVKNKMKFHPHKCKVLSVSNSMPPLLGILPYIQFIYQIGESPLDYVESEKDLGVDINPKLNFNFHCNRIISKAKQMLGLTKRTCHFVNDSKRRRALYLALVRSQFEHCSVIWRPNGKTLTQSFENVQKQAIKWILFEENIRYNTQTTYIQKCRQVDLLPISSRFDLTELVVFHKIVYELSPVKLPSYLTFYNGISRLRSSHFDRLTIISNVHPRSNAENSTNALGNSFFYRTHLKWNNLPIEIRDKSDPVKFKTLLTKYIWHSLNANSVSCSDDEDLLDNG